MMKKIYRFMFSVALTALSFCAGAQEKETYYILHAKGEIHKQNSDALLKTGDKILASDQLVFAKPDACLSVMSVEKGRFVLQPIAKQEASGVFGVSDLVKVFVDLQGGVAQASTKSSKITNKIALEKFFMNQDILVIDEHKVWISPDLYPKDDTHFFYVRYNKGGETINKKLPHNADFIVFRKSELLKVYEEDYVTTRLDSVRLFYYDMDAKSSEQLAVFNINTPDKGSLMNEISILCELLNNSKTQSKEVLSFLRETYGVVDEDDAAGLGL
jgi:hypothetical protein